MQTPCEALRMRTERVRAREKESKREDTGCSRKELMPQKGKHVKSTITVKCDIYILDYISMDRKLWVWLREVKGKMALEAGRTA